MPASFDALLIVSFGGPEGRDDVIPFLENVLRGRNVPRERLLTVAEHYQRFGGVSPINEQNRRLIRALGKELSEHGPQLKIYWGNRNWHPLLRDTIQQMANDGVRSALAFVTSAYSSYSSCRQYLENIEAARLEVGIAAPRIVKLRPFYNHPLFVEANASNVRAALDLIPRPRQANTMLLFTAHSIPQSMAVNCKYEIQLREIARLISRSLNHLRYALVYQSRSGPPNQSWLEPDVCDELRKIKSQGITDVVIAPVGFVSDHMEIIYDLDTEARRVCDDLGLHMVRAKTVGTDPLFVKMIRELIREQIELDGRASFVGELGQAASQCPIDCCLAAPSK
ncbi:MAG TPA: ferrochelatase [Pyrinomonadaceae bacterium]|nr:ferrochelatase [Pyrinomonadaceae bacterium]